MRALKLLVAGMGIAIVVATAVLIAVIVNRAGKLDDGVAARDATVSIPRGFRVIATEVAGDRAVVRLEGRDPGAAGDEIRLLVIDLDGSNRHRTIRLTASPEATR